jgi:uncharacterized protein
MSRFYHEDSRRLQDEFDTRRLADRIEDVLARETLDDDDVAFVTGADMFFLATVDDQGQPQCSYKGGDPGFVKVLDPGTLAFPSYDGNGMFLSLGNLLRSPKIGMLFMDWSRPTRLRVNGIASVDENDPLLSEYERAQLVVRVQTTHVFPNCGRYIHRMELVERSRFVPRADCVPPIPSWKQAAWSRDVLAANDPAREPPP